MYCMKFYITLFLAVCIAHTSFGQIAYGAKGGLTIGTQRWNNAKRDPLFGYNGSAFVEFLSETSKYGVVIEAGYHTRGSSIWMQNVTYLDPTTNQVVSLPNRKFDQVFNNVSLMFGGKSNYALSPTWNTYYMLGLRGEYTVSDSLTIYEAYKEHINRVNYGVTLGGGIETKIKNLGIFLEFQVQPDFSKQIYVLPGKVYNSYTRTLDTYPEQNIINTSFELTLGFRLYSSPVEYEEE